MGWKDSTSLGYFPASSNGMMMVILKICGQWEREKDELNMESNSLRVKGASGSKNM